MEYSYITLNDIFSPEELWVTETLFKGYSNVSAAFTKEGEEQILNFAVRNGVAPLLYRKKEISRLSPTLQSALRNEYLKSLGRNTALMVIGDEIAKKLNSAGINVIFLKGSYLVRFVYYDSALRPMSDLDILVDESDAFDAYHLLNGKECKRDYLDRLSQHLPSFNYRGASIEIHYRLFPVNIKYKLPVKRLLQCGHTDSELNTLLFNTAHNLLYLTLHFYYTYKQGGVRLSWLYDLKFIVDNKGDELDEQFFRDEVESLNLEKPVRLIFTLLTLLQSGSFFSLFYDKSCESEAKDILKLFGLVSNRNIYDGYAYMYERISNTPGLFNKISFLKYLLLNDRTGKKRSFFKRLFYLIKNSLKVIIFKINSFLKVK
ncbi:nucleotidyltransferase family protein [Marinilabiliaceae bacterium ANBcel2]|nr:nucleotidyltransferase family protein [Marinilabiliaceae bacterium ANBcel2]